MTINFKTSLAVCLGLFLLVLVPYSQVYSFSFLNYDDPGYVTANPYVLGGLRWEGLTAAWTRTFNSMWSPLTIYSHMADYALFGLNAGWHHCVNVAFHVANTLLLFLVLARVTRATGRSAFLAALFAIHPLHVESVAWISERKDVLSAFFWLLTMAAYIRYCGQKTLKNYIFVAVAFALGLLAKPMLITLPFALLLFDVWPLKRFTTPPLEEMSLPRRFLRLFAEKVPLIALSLLCSIATYVAQRYSGAVITGDRLSLVYRLGNALVAYAMYVLKTFWPSGLAVIYPHPGVALPPRNVVLAATFLVAVSIFAIVTIRKRPYIFVGWFWFLGTLVPVIGIVQVGTQAMADRYSYIPHMGLFVALVWLVSDLAEKYVKQRRLLPTAGALVLVVLTGVCWVQVGYWRDSETLFRRAIAVTSNNFAAHEQLARHLHSTRRLEEAAEHYVEVIRIRPDHYRALTNLGSIMGNLGRYNDAVEAYDVAVRLRPDYAEGHARFGMALGQLNRLEEAAAQFSLAIELEPTHVEAHYGMGVALGRLGKTQEAVDHYEAALRSDPNHLQAMLNLASSLAELGKVEEGIAQYKEALRRHPNTVMGRMMLARQYEKLGRVEDAADIYAEVMKMDPSNEEARKGFYRFRKL